MKVTLANKDSFIVEDSYTGFSCIPNPITSHVPRNVHWGWAITSPTVVAALLAKEKNDGLVALGRMNHELNLSIKDDDMAGFMRHNAPAEMAFARHVVAHQNGEIPTLTVYRPKTPRSSPWMLGQPSTRTTWA